MKIGWVEIPFAANALHRQRHRRKVEDESVGEICRLQITPNDREMNVLQTFHRLQLDNDFLFHQKVEAVFADLVISIEKRDGLLPNESDAADCKFNRQRLLVDDFKEARPKFGVNRDCGTNHLTCEAFLP